jgi:hypothetical protein
VSEIVSKSEFARRLDVDPAAVSAWISRKKLTAPALRDDGTIDVELAVEQLRERLEHARSDTDLERAASALADAPEGDGASSASPTAALIERQRAQRVEENDIRLRKLRIEELERAGRLVRLDAITTAYARSLGQFLAATDNWITDLAGELGLSAEQLVASRASWRRFRTREADAAAQRVSALPEFEPADGR